MIIISIYFLFFFLFMVYFIYIMTEEALKTVNDDFCV